MARSDETRTIAVSPEVAALIDDAVALGGYRSPNEAIRDALQRRKSDDDDRLGLSSGDLNRLWDEGVASGPGRALSPEDIEREVFERARPSQA